MAAIRRDDEPGVVPNRLAHGGGHDGIVAGRKGKHGAFQFVFSFSCVPMHQPIEAFVEARDIERLGRRKVRRAAGAPEGLHRRVRLALDSPLEPGDPRRRDMAGEAIEALNTDQSPELPALTREQP